MPAFGRRTLLATLAATCLAAAGMAGAAAAPTAASSCSHAHARPKAVGIRTASHAVVCLVNKRRHDHGLGSLHSNADLRRAARDHSRRMDGGNCFDHVCSGEAGVLSRLTHAGYLLQGLLSWAYGEDIYWGPGGLGTPASTVRGWMNSAPHRANILSGRFEDIGIGVAWGSPSSAHANAGLYTADFGYRKR
jgi:uncharacterized protein YkwD